MTTRADIEERIRDHDQANGRRFRQVAGAADIEAVMAGRVTPPGAYVIRLGRKSGRNRAATGVSQAVAVSFAVMLVIADRRGDRGTDSSDEMEALCDQVQAALLNWAPPGARRGLEYAGGRLTSRKDARLYWQEVYTLPGQQLRQISQPA
jgi:hypothetical protein